ncbi:condensin-2 complex subunit h2 [Anaeramoeba flamelloides]|uniref:Condensin-2 complex subunit h2 n=1 Tax=Anaeramoeba flamelloides TaxID=1746091 RepID=A0AAV7YD18_9EUKA|nr:condensin-2 complex subunit h2 [Anaeramoeba flamelloides]
MTQIVQFQQEREKKFMHLLKPIRGLAQNWNIDIANELEDYLVDLEEISISFDGGSTNLNFVEAALLIQSSACIYSKKVEYLYNLIYQTLDLLSERKKRQKKKKSQDDDENGENEDETENFLTLDDTLKIDKNIDLRDSDDVNRILGLLDFEERSTQRRRNRLYQQNQELSKIKLLLRTPIYLLGQLETEQSIGNKDYFMTSCQLHSTGALFLDETDLEIFTISLKDPKNNLNYLEDLDNFSFNSFSSGFSNQQSSDFFQTETNQSNSLNDQTFGIGGLSPMNESHSTKINQDNTESKSDGISLGGNESLSGFNNEENEGGDDDDDEDDFDMNDENEDENEEETMQQKKQNKLSQSARKVLFGGDLNSSAEPIDPWVKLESYDKGAVKDRKFRKSKTCKLPTKLVDHSNYLESFIGTSDPWLSRTVMTNKKIEPFSRNDLKKLYYKEYSELLKKEKTRISRSITRNKNVDQKKLTQTGGSEFYEMLMMEQDEETMLEHGRAIGLGNQDFEGIGGFEDDDDDDDDENNDDFDLDNQGVGGFGSINESQLLSMDGISLGGDDSQDNSGLPFSNFSTDSSLLREESTKNKSFYSYEDLCRQHIEAYLSNSATFIQETELSRRVSDWRDKLDPLLDTQNQRPPFDIHQCGRNVMNSFAFEDEKNCVFSQDFGKVVDGLEQYDICRHFLAVLQLVNDRNLDISHEEGGQSIQDVIVEEKNGQNDGNTGGNDDKYKLVRVDDSTRSSFQMKILDNTAKFKRFENEEETSENTESKSKNNSLSKNKKMKKKKKKKDNDKKKKKKKK